MKKRIGSKCSGAIHRTKRAFTLIKLLVVSAIMVLTLLPVLGYAGAGKDYPNSIIVNCGKIRIQLNVRSYWNINKLWYEEEYLGESISWWGTVFAIPNEGFIGSGHKSTQGANKGEGEELKILKLFADGNYLSPEQVAESPFLTCQEFRLTRSAQVKSITYDYTLIIKQDKLYESSKVQASKAQRLELMYNFMHPWSRQLTDYYVQVTDDKSESGTFKADGSFPFRGPAQWITLYDNARNIGIISKASGDAGSILLWDRGSNKKTYLRSLERQSIKAGEVYSYKMVTDFYRAASADWQEKAKSLANKIKGQSKSPSVGMSFSSFPEFRRKAQRMTPFSPEDYTLGRELLIEIRKLAKKRKPMFNRPHVFVRSQPYRSGRLYYCRYSWHDRPLFASRLLWEDSDSDYKYASFRKTFELYKSYGLDGYASFMWPYQRLTKVLYETAANMKLDPEKFHILLSLTPALRTCSKIDEGTLDLFANSPYSFRFNGRNVAASYITDRQKPEKLAEELNTFEKRLNGGKVMLLAQIQGFSLGKEWCGLRLPGYSIYSLYCLYLEKGVIPATLLLHHLDYLSEYLRVSGGLSIGTIYKDSSLKLNASFYDEVALPLYAAAIAQEEFNGKKILAICIRAGYTSYHGSQTISRDGSKTLRKYLDVCIKHNVDIMIGSEWDELNEDTNFEPMVAKPMAVQRIMKYYMMSKLRHQPPTPNPGDDLSLPNLIISQRRQLMPGWTMDVELLNVPDTDKGKSYTVALELLNQYNEIVFKSEPIFFNTAKLKDHTFNLPSENFASCQLLQPRLTINYNDKQKIISEGLPFTVMRTTTCWDQTYFSTPVRNVLLPLASKVEFKETGKILAPGVKQISLDASLEFADKLNTVEVVQDSHEIYAYDAKNEYLQNNPARILYKFSSSYINNPRIYVEMKTNLSNAPSAMTFTYQRGLDKVINPTLKATAVAAFSDENAAPVRVSDWTSRKLISIEKQDIDKAVLTVTGVRTSGQNKDKKFEWQISLKELGSYGVKSKVFDDGLMLALQTQYRPCIVPLPLNSKSVKFTTMLAADEPNGILAIRAVSDNGKVYWSKGFPVNNKVSAVEIPIQVYSEDKGAITLKAAENRVPDVKYEFSPRYGNILSTPAGREFYAHAGGFLSTAIAFTGLINSKHAIPMCYWKYHNPNGVNKSAPVWEKQTDGKWALRFDGKYGNFLALPNTAIPQRAGFTMTFEVKPEILKPEQILFAQYGVYLTGFRLSVVDGKFHIEFKRRTPYNKTLPEFSLVKFATKVPLFTGKWQKVIFKYDEDQVTISANGKTESFPCEGIDQWLTISSFGGSGRRGWNGETLYYQGLLRLLEIKHTAATIRF